MRPGIKLLYAAVGSRDPFVNILDNESNGCHLRNFPICVVLDLGRSNSKVIIQGHPGLSKKSKTLMHPLLITRQHYESHILILKRLSPYSI